MIQINNFLKALNPLKRLNPLKKLNPLKRLNRSHTIWMLYVSGQPFSSSTEHDWHEQGCRMNELLNYEQYFVKHNKSLKKAHMKLMSEEKRIFSEYLSTEKYQDLIEFLIRNKKYQMCHPDTLSHFDTFLLKSETIPKDHQIRACHALTNFAQYQYFQAVMQPYQHPFSKAQWQHFTSEEIILYYFNHIILTKGLHKHYARQHQIILSPELLLNDGRINGFAKNLLEELRGREYLGFMQEQYELLIKYLASLLKQQTRLIYQDENHSSKKRSILEKEIQCFLAALKYSSTREVQLDSFLVDFIVQPPQNQNSFILEINGSYHYTIKGNLKPKEIMRGLILNNWKKLRLIHYVDYNQTHGYRNKLDYIKNIMEKRDVNWQPQMQGHDSNWQLDNHYSQFK